MPDILLSTTENFVVLKLTVSGMQPWFALADTDNVRLLSVSSFCAVLMQPCRSTTVSATDVICVTVMLCVAGLPVAVPPSPKVHDARLPAGIVAVNVCVIGGGHGCAGLTE